MKPLDTVKIRKEKEELIINISAAKSILSQKTHVIVYEDENGLRLVPV